MKTRHLYISCAIGATIGAAFIAWGYITGTSNHARAGLTLIAGYAVLALAKKWVIREGQNSE